MKVYVFAGPSLPPEVARKNWAEPIYLPPVAQGDVYRIACRKPWGIGIIDGLFFVVVHVLPHQNIRHHHAKPTRLQATNGGQAAVQGSGKLHNGVVDFGTVRINADLYLLYSKPAHPIGMIFPNHESIRLDFHVEH